MNKERILALADLIEKQPHTTIGAADGFCMSDFTHTCGTPACIAGWAAFVAGKSEDNAEDFEAQDYLGLDNQQANELFYAWSSEISLYAITPSQASSTLRRLAETGEVKWEDA